MTGNFTLAPRRSLPFVALLACGVGSSTVLHAQPSTPSSRSLDQIFQEVIEQATKEAQANRGYLGAAVSSLTAEKARELRLSDNAGVLVQSVQPGSPAERAGLRAGDVIRQFNGRAVQDSNGFVALVQGSAPGAQVAMAIVRNGKPVNVGAVLASANSAAGRTAANDPQPGSLIVPGKQIGTLSLGMTEADAAKLLSESPECSGVSFGGTDLGISECKFKSAGVRMTFNGLPNSALSGRRADTIEADAGVGPASNKYGTDRRIRVGSPVKDVVAAYGEPADRARTDSGVIMMHYNSIGMMVLVGRGDIVQGIRIFKPE